MSTNIFIYLEPLRHGTWIFEGERIKNVDYDPEDPGVEPEYGPAPLFLGANPPLHYLFGLPIDTVLEGPSPPFGRRGLPHDISAELGQWATAEAWSRVHGWVTVRELDAFDWNAVTEVRMVVKRKYIRAYRDSVENSVVSDMAIDWSDRESRRSLRGVARRDLPSLAPDVFADITWRPTYADMAGYNFMEEVVQALGRRYGPSDLARIIYWFD
ncbi:MAG TPA: hypothetical protein VNL35_16165 [Chloroflexota bacterium]|nr:hypothetical protein [Chloroflexota bacterium]